MASGNRFRCFVISFVLLCMVAVVVYAFQLMWEKEADHQENSNSTGSRMASTLKFVIVISRHGNRRYFTFPNDPYPMNDTKLWPYGVAELTIQGRVQMYNLGAKIRSLYNGFLREEYYTSDIYSSSTAMDRVLMSGEAFLAGLYPPTGYQLWNRAILWQPISLYSNSPDKTVELINCPRFLNRRAQALSNFSQQNAADLLEVNTYISKYAAANISGYFGFLSVWDAFISEDSEGCILPDWTKKVYPQPMTDLAAKMYIDLFASNDEIIKLVIGSFLGELLGVMKNKINGTMKPDRKIYYYSGHDSTIIALQAVLGIPQAAMVGMVKPGSALIYEIHQDPDVKMFSIQVLYIDSSSVDLEPVPVSIPGCDICDFNQFFNISHKFIITDFEKECELNSTKKDNVQ